jgi:hypothetical protein
MDYLSFKNKIDKAISLNKETPKNYAKIGKILNEVRNFKPVKNNNIKN